MATFNDEHRASLADISQKNTDTQRATKGKLITGRQRNHGVWRLPPEIEQEEGVPFWMAVALWALRQGRPVTRGDISQAFSVAPRRAADVMTYIICDRADQVRVCKEVVRVNSGHRVATFLVTSVTPRTDVPAVSDKLGSSKTRPESSAVARKSEQDALAQARRTFLFQRRTISGSP